MKVKGVFATNAYSIGILLLTIPVTGCGGINGLAPASPEVPATPQSAVNVEQTGATGPAQPLIKERGRDIF